MTSQLYLCLMSSPKFHTERAAKLRGWLYTGERKTVHFPGITRHLFWMNTHRRINTAAEAARLTAIGKQPLASAVFLDSQTYFMLLLCLPAGCIIHAIGILGNSKNCALTFQPQTGSHCGKSWEAHPLCKNNKGSPRCVAQSTADLKITTKDFTKVLITSCSNSSTWNAHESDRPWGMSMDDPDVTPVVTAAIAVPQLSCLH